MGSLLTRKEPMSIIPWPVLEAKLYVPVGIRSRTERQDRLQEGLCRFRLKSRSCTVEHLLA